MKNYITILLLLLNSEAYAVYWNQKADFPYIGYGGVGFSIGTKGYIGTGWYNNVYSQEMWEWDQATDVWSQKASCPGGGRYWATGFSIGTKGYLGGGQSDIQFFSDFWEWDQATNNWTQIATISNHQPITAVGFSIGTKGYVGTGEGLGTYDAFWEYDPVPDAWTQKANLPGDGRRGATGFSIGTKGYIGTGHSEVTGLELNDFWEWDQASNSWTQKANVGSAIRVNATGFSIDTTGYIGMGANSNGHLKDFWAWDQATNVWVQKPDLPADAREMAVGFSIGPFGYIATGENIGVYSDVWEFCHFNNCATGIDEIQHSNIEIYPNPVLSAATLKTDMRKSQTFQINIYNTSGAKVYSSEAYFMQGIHQQNINLEFLKPGVYLLEIKSAKQTFHRKIQKE